MQIFINKEMIHTNRTEAFWQETLSKTTGSISAKLCIKHGETLQGHNEDIPLN